MDQAEGVVEHVVAVPAKQIWNVKGVPDTPKEERNLEIVAALAAGQSQAEVARRWGIHKSRVRKIYERHLLQIRNVRRVDRARLIDRLWDFVDRVVDSLTDEDIEDSTLQQRLVSMGVAIDKARLLSGEATVIMGTERRRKIEELLPAMIEEAKRRGVVLDLPPSAMTEIKELQNASISDGNAT